MTIADKTVKNIYLPEGTYDTYNSIMKTNFNDEFVSKEHGMDTINEIEKRLAF